MKKNIVSFLTSIFLLGSLISSANAFSSSDPFCRFGLCSDDHRHHFLHDECESCGEYRLHYFKTPITFWTAKNDVPVWSKATQDSEKVTNISLKDTEIELDAILRNRHGNVWFKVAEDDGFIYIGNLYLNFDILAAQNYQKLCDNNVGDSTTLVAFYNLVSPAGPADYKKWLDPGGKKIPYNVSVDGTLYEMTAEEIGNIHYAFLGRTIGLPRDILLYAGGALNVMDDISDSISISTFFSGIDYNLLKTTVELLSECSNSYCDNEDDVYVSQKGIDYFETGEFIWE